MKFSYQESCFAKGLSVNVLTSSFHFLCTYVSCIQTKILTNFKHPVDLMLAGQDEVISSKSAKQSWDSSFA